MEPVSVKNERGYCPFDDLETSGRGQVEDLLVSGITDVDILTCARNKERLMMMRECHTYLFKQTKYRLCRADSRGVWQLPPRSTSCLIYLNGPSAALGVLRATAISGLTSTSGERKDRDDTAGHKPRSSS